MSRLDLRIPGCWCLLLVGWAAASSGDDAKPQHRHYEEPPGFDEPSASGQLAPRLQNLGDHTFPVTTTSPQAQRFVDQGLNLAYGFNHAESARAFREAARLDPLCAMAFWGQALVLGPNINAPMDPAAEPEALELARRAAELAPNASEKEQALIAALQERYSGDPADRAARDLAYAEAMASVVERFPDDLDVATLYAEAMMDLRPWNYWMRDGSPYPGTPEIVALLESVMERNPRHPGALHLYIHLIEPTDEPERAEQAADMLADLMPGAGHIVHMPSHIYQRVGRYADSAAANERAILADEDYIAQCRAQGLYPMGYYPHNIHFLWFAATAEGRSAVAIEAARKVASKIDDAALAELPLLAGFRVVPYWALARFGRWEELLAEPEPAGDPFLTGAWHYVRGLAQIGRGDLAGAQRELHAVRRLVGDPRLDYPMFSPNTAARILAVAPEVLAGELAAARGDYDEAIGHLDRAVRLEDGLVYTEPTEWQAPPRLALGAVLLEAGRPAEAETVYWDHLRKFPEDGWALFGLGRALRALGEDEQAAMIEERFERAWARADVVLTASRLR